MTGKTSSPRYHSLPRTAVYDGYRRFVERRMRTEEIIVSGGGAKNHFFHGRTSGGISAAFRFAGLRQFGMSGDAKEAICFAILANETMAASSDKPATRNGCPRQVVQKSNPRKNLYAIVVGTPFAGS